MGTPNNAVEATGTDTGLLFFFLILVVLFNNCGLFEDQCSLLFFFLLLVIVFTQCFGEGCGGGLFGGLLGG